MLQKQSLLAYPLSLSIGEVRSIYSQFQLLPDNSRDSIRPIGVHQAAFFRRCQHACAKLRTVSFGTHETSFPSLTPAERSGYVFKYIAFILLNALHSGWCVGQAAR